jgi:hypothetical protein
MSLTLNPIQLISPVGSLAGQQLFSSGPASPVYWANNSMTNETFAVNTSFTPGTSTSITLTGTYGSISNIWVYFDAAYQGPDQILSLVGKVLTFTSPIPVGVSNVYVKGGTVFTSTVSNWGAIGGAISAQTDLQVALNTIINNMARFSPSTDFSNAAGINTFYAATI